MARRKGNPVFANSFEPTGQTPLDARLVVELRTDLMNAYQDNNVYDGMAVTVKNGDGGKPEIWVLKDKAAYLAVAGAGHTPDTATYATYWQRMDAGAADLSNVPDLTQVTALSSRVTAVESSTTANAGEITALKNKVNHATTGLDATKAIADAAAEAAQTAQDRADANTNLIGSDTEAGTVKGRIKNLEDNKADKSQLSNYATKAEVSGAMHFKGVTTTALTDGATTATLSVKGSNLSAFVAGDTVICGNKEFVWDGSAWREFGDSGDLATQDYVSATYATKAEVNAVEAKADANTAAIGTDTTANTVKGRIKALEDGSATKTELGSVSSDLAAFKAQKGAANGLAPLDVNGKVPEDKLPQSFRSVQFFEGIAGLPSAPQDASTHDFRGVYFTQEYGFYAMGNGQNSAYLNWDSRNDYRPNDASIKAYSDRIYVNKEDNVAYRFDGTTLVALSKDYDSEIATLTTGLGTKADKADTYTKTQTDEMLAGKADKIATYAKAEIDEYLSAKANQTDLDDAVNDIASNTAAIATKADQGQLDTAINDLSELTTEVGTKADQATTYTKTEVDTALSAKGNASDVTANATAISAIQGRLDTLEGADTFTAITNAEIDAMFAAS